VKRINKILSTEYSYSIAALYLLFFLFLSSGKELLHNHKPDESEGADCPTLIISDTFGSAISAHFELPKEFIVESIVNISQNIFISQSKPSTTFLRGPPLF
jgi:hypothetical protein